MSIFTILLGGPIEVTSRLIRQVSGSRVIAADGGIRHAISLGLDVELWVGDFDSSDDELIRQYEHIEKQKYPAEKDETDGEIAIAEALKRGATELILVGGLGGRSDHALTHVMLALGLKQKGISVFISSGSEEAYPLLAGSQGLELPVSCDLSIIVFSALQKFSISGVKWPLEKTDLEPGNSLTMSNVVTGPVRLDLEGGRGVIFVMTTKVI